MKPIQILAILIVAILLNSCNNCNHNYQTPNGLINNETANNYEEAYKNNQYEVINAFLSNDGVARTDHREFLFSLDEMENYIHYVKQKSDSLGYENLGLRVYLGAKLDTTKKFKSTVFFVPTNNTITRGAPPRDNSINSNGIKALNYGSSGEPAYEFNGN